MANPQKENGHIQIAIDIMDALAGIRVPGEARQCLDVIIRKTYGWHKKEDQISLSQFCLLTKMPKCSIRRGLLKLIRMNLIIYQKAHGGSAFYAFNKDFDTWKPFTKRQIIYQKANQHLPFGKSAFTKRRNTKETITKETITKEKRASENKFPDDSIQMNLAIFFYQQILQNDAKAKKPNFQKWAADIDKMLKIDHRTIEEVEALIFWAQGDSFWKANILSPAKLREKFSTLWIQAKEKTAPRKREMRVTFVPRSKNN